MVSESDLLTRLREILSTSDLDTATAGSVRRQLEKDFGVDLSDRKVFVRDQIDIYLETHRAKAEEEEEEEAEEETEGGEGSENVEQNDGVKEEDEDEEEEAVENGDKRKRKKTVDKGVVKRGGFNKICSLSPQLQEIVGEPEMARTEVVKRMWAYIREKDLQDPANRRNIRCDEALHSLFRVKTINMFQMNKSLSKHIWPLSREDDHVRQNKKGEESDPSVSEEDVSNAAEPEEEEEEEEDEEEVKKVTRRKKEIKKRRSAKVDKEVKKRGGGGGFTKVCSLSPELQKFTGVPTLARTEVVKKLWAYIRENNLQDPNNKRDILCDESLRALFEVDCINMFQMNKALSKHIWPLNEEAPDNTSPKEMECKEEQEEGAV